MAKYKAEPHYAVGGIHFDYFGNYETSDAQEIKQLDELAPKWIKRVDGPKKEKQAEEKAKPEPKKAPAKPKSSKK